MKIPVGINVTEGVKEDLVLQMLRNIYGQRQADRVGNNGPTRLRPRLSPSSHPEGDVYEDTIRYQLDRRGERGIGVADVTEYLCGEEACH